MLLWLKGNRRFDVSTQAQEKLQIRPPVPAYDVCRTVGSGEHTNFLGYRIATGSAVRRRGYGRATEASFED